MRGDADNPDIGEGMQRHPEKAKKQEAFQVVRPFQRCEVERDVRLDTVIPQPSKQRREGHQVVERRTEVQRKGHAEILQQGDEIAEITDNGVTPDVA